MTYPKKFLEIMEQTFHWEGGVSDQQYDAGGYTNMGVTMPFLSEYLGRTATREDIRSLTKDVAIAAYHKNVWLKHRIFVYPEDVQALVFNCFTGSLTFGYAITRAIQKYLGLVPDGVVGPKTIEKFQDTNEHPELFAREMALEALRLLVRECVRNPTQLKFLEGWFNRYSTFIPSC